MLLAGIVNVLTALLALSGILFYVLVYTKLLKRSTPQNIVIGGAAGAIPPLVGWAAATGNLTLPALVLFAVVFLWTPPHFWALALLIKRDYANAGVPMLPVVRGERETAKEILLYTAALVAFTLAPALWGQFGLVYLVAAAALGAGFLGLAWNLRRERTPAPGRAPLPLLARVPRGALRRDGARYGARMSDRTARGLLPAARADPRAGQEQHALRARPVRIALLLFAGVIGLAFVYLALD